MQDHTKETSAGSSGDVHRRGLLAGAAAAGQGLAAVLSQWDA